MEEAVNSSIDHGQIAFFIGSLCQEADLIYRFGYCLTLSDVGAERLLKETYRSLVGTLHRFLGFDSSEIRMNLMILAWSNYSSWTETFPTCNSSALVYLQNLDPQIRVPLAVVDALGFTPGEAATILELNETEVRRHLSEGRKALVSIEL